MRDEMSTGRKGEARSPGKRLVLALYWPVRPLLRPLAWRLRTFLLGPVQAELAAIRARQDDIRAEIAALRSAVERLERTERGAAGGEMPNAALEAALLTLAMNRRAG